MWNMVFAQTSEAPADAPAKQGLQSILGSPFIMIAAFMVIMYMFLLRPGQKREKERQAMLTSLSKGDEVVTSGGLCGSIVGLKEKTVVLRVDEEGNTKMEFLRGSISQVVSRAGDTE